MSHERFESLLLAALESGDGDAWRQALPPEARAHAASCESCAGLLRALELAAQPDPAQEPPAGYGAELDRSLARRLPGAPPRSDETPAPLERATLLRLAAGLAALVAVAWIGVRLAGAPAPRSAEGGASVLAAALAAHPDDAAAALDELAPATWEETGSGEAAWTAGAATGDADLVPLADPADALDELGAPLSDEAAAELVARLREEMKS